jgi:hypothetical protein
MTLEEMKEELIENCDCGDCTCGENGNTEETYISEPLMVDIEECQEENLDLSEYKRGLKDASYVCGLYNAMVNSGISIQFTQEYLMNKINADYNVEMTKLNCNTSIECSKNQVIVSEKNSL